MCLTTTLLGEERTEEVERDGAYRERKRGVEERGKGVHGGGQRIRGCSAESTESTHCRENAQEVTNRVQAKYKKDRVRQKECRHRVKREYMQRTASLRIAQIIQRHG